MVINSKSYKLTEDNYTSQGTKKNKIVIGVTYSNNMSHYTGWVNRNNGKYTRTAMFTVAINGEIYQHFSPNYFSNFMLKPELDESSITILLENEGWLIKDLSNENKYINYVGHIYNRKDSVFEKKWRSQMYWAPFTDKQVDSTIKLVAELCKNFNIPTDVVSHNTNLDNAHKFNGVLYRSNFEKYYTDITPAWDCKYFKNKLEKNEKHG
tara:strand:+ start:15658 stop:16284 length:627 start_codon:yes stop_codon:yes gene_type:complete